MQALFIPCYNASEGKLIPKICFESFNRNYIKKCPLIFIIFFMSSSKEMLSTQKSAKNMKCVHYIHSRRSSHHTKFNTHFKFLALFWVRNIVAPPWWQLAKLQSFYIQVYHISRLKKEKRKETISTSKSLLNYSGWVFQNDFTCTENSLFFISCLNWILWKQWIKASIKKSPLQYFLAFFPKSQNKSKYN